MRSLVMALVLAVTATPVLAADAPVATAGVMLRDAKSMRLGHVEKVRSDGSVGVIVESKYVIVPAATLSMVDGKLTTSLTKKEIVEGN